ncbi:MAG TPA: GNAT family N-acetyltransferase [Acidobacteriota bacterium]|nr:GNAT family N-acetyltransferase [Acidobacteriota bacterium]
MFWRLTDARKRWSRVKGAPNQQAFRKLVKSGKAHGILALDDREPVGWCSFGPKAHFPGLETTRSYRTESAAGLWAINCFYLVKEYRRIGLGQLLAGEAVKAIRRRGGKIVEAYPVTLTRNGKRLPPAFSFTGPEVIFTRLGFKEVQRLAPSRPVYRLDLG